MPATITLKDFRAARERIAGRVRRTPMMAPAPVKTPLPGGDGLLLKLENLQVTGSFKARGASNALLSLPEDAIGRGLCTASGGNHGLAVAYAAWSAGVPAVIYLPGSTPAAKAKKLKEWGAEVVVEGKVWDEANAAAKARAAADGLAYVHPFADPAVIAGQGTLGLEILEDTPDLDVLVVAIGGGGLISGVAAAAKAVRPALKIIGVEPVGAPTLHASLEAGRLVELASISTKAGTLAPRRSEQINLEMIRQNVERIVLVEDEEMAAAARWLWFELGIAAELSGAASVAALMAGRVPVPRDAKVCAIICGAGTDGLG